MAPPQPHTLGMLTRLGLWEALREPRTGSLPSWCLGSWSSQAWLCLSVAPSDLWGVGLPNGPCCLVTTAQTLKPSVPGLRQSVTSGWSLPLGSLSFLICKTQSAVCPVALLFLAFAPDPFLQEGPGGSHSLT